LVSNTNIENLIRHGIPISRYQGMNLLLPCCPKNKRK